ncbi:MAG: class I SAM-dependent methyltransferase [Nitrospira defluvii]|nr:class I SAM-dependent methyltransferase [Nitrospira defluvii]
MKNYLPVLDNISHDLRNGRSIYDGYVRGWGIQFGDLREQVRKDPLYKKALALSSGRTVVSEDNRINLFLILRFFLDQAGAGDIIEFGSYRGGNAIFLAHIVAQLYPGTRVYSLDTFAGMPATNSDIDAHQQGDFGEVDLTELRQFADANGLDNLEFVQGLFQDTAPGVLGRTKNIVLAHIDCDIFSSVAYSYEIVKAHMALGGYLVFDDATVSSCLGATEVVESMLIRRDGLNSEQISPQFVFRAGLNHPGPR